MGNTTPERFFIKDLQNHPLALGSVLKEGYQQTSVDLTSASLRITQSYLLPVDGKGHEIFTVFSLCAHFQTSSGEMYTLVSFCGLENGCRAFRQSSALSVQC